jgi:hypothetical protein
MYADKSNVRLRQNGVRSSLPRVCYIAYPRVTVSGLVNGNEHTERSDELTNIDAP